MSKKRDLSYEEYSEIRKQGQKDGSIPSWMATAGVQVFYKKYLYDAENPRQQFERIARTAAKYSPVMISRQDEDKNLNLSSKQAFQDYWYEKFFNVLWKGYLACSTPVLSNTGTDRGMPISCSGGIKVKDSVEGFYEAAKEVAILTKNSFGTAVDLSAIRPRGSKFKGGGTASGVLPVLKMIQQVTVDVSQGSNRRGAVACYIDIEHKDVEEVLQYLEHFPDHSNIGWIVRDKFVEKLKQNNPKALKRFQDVLYVKSVTGKGYFHFIDKANRSKGEAYEKNGLEVSASQLCNEIMLHSDENETYQCCLSWMNLSKYDEWKDTDAIYVGTVFLDCILSYFIEKASNVSGMEKVIRGAVKGRPIGLGAGGLATLYQKRMLPFESAEAYLLNKEIFSKINQESLQASKDLAVVCGEPEYCKGLGIRFTHRIAVAPTKTTAAIYGGISEGINPDPAFSFIQSTAAGEVHRVIPTFLELIKSKGLNIEECILEVAQNKGSVQKVKWLSDHEKQVFKTAFEIDQFTILRQASSRQKDICQGQSLNFYIDKRRDESYISQLHKVAFLDENIKGLYYLVGKREGDDEEVVEQVACESCQ